MITGGIRDGLPWSKLYLPGLTTTVSIEFVVDTGFEGELSLPHNLASRLRSKNPGTRTVQMANGQLVKAGYFEIDLEWDDEPRLTEVLIMDGNPLIGVELLDRFRLTIDFVPRGEVSTEPL